MMNMLIPIFIFIYIFFFLQTPLHDAAEKGHEEIFKTLPTHKTRIQRIIWRYEIPHFTQLLKVQLHQVESIRVKNKNPKNEVGYTPLHNADVFIIYQTLPRDPFDL